jgi:hypothetical protein
MTASNNFNGLHMECPSCESSAVRPFNIISVVAQNIHRIRELRLQQSLMSEESPHSHKATPGKEKTCDHRCNSLNIGVLLSTETSQSDMMRKKKTELSIYNE